MSRPQIDRDRLATALEHANLPTLLLVLAQVTGDATWLEDPYRPTPPEGMDDHDHGGFAPEVQAEIRARALEILVDLPSGAGDDLDVDRLPAMLSASYGGERVRDDYAPLLGEELGIRERWVDVPTPDGVEPPRVAIIGGGLSGLCQAIHLQRAGVPYVVLEKNHDVGGTWFENTYPGCGVDSPTHLYAFSFEQRPSWSKYFAKQEELHAYYRGVAERHGVLDHFRFGHEVTAARWDDERSLWVLDVVADGHEEVVEAPVVVSAVGLLNRPAIPAIDGLDDFDGPVVHTAEWPEGLDVTGKRVAVVGTGASAMQLVPALAGVAERVTVHQRSPQWSVPYPTYGREVPDEVRFLMEHVPYYLGWYRLRLMWKMGDRLHPLLQIDPEYAHPDRAINRGNDALRGFLERFIRHELREHPELVDDALPTYPVYGKRLLMDNGWFRTIRRDDVDLVTGPIERVEAGGVRTADGTLHEADVVVLATGFQSLRVLGPMEIVGRSGTRLRETWGEDDARAYLGIAIRDLPNFFCLYGPNTNTGHSGTVVLGVELQVRYVMQLIAAMVEGGIESVEVTEEAHDAYNAELDAALDRTIWTHPGMTTYYRNSRGRIVVNSPWKYLDYWRHTREPDLAAYEVRERGASPVTTPA
ncbi:MAG: NAD(P)/FAD-dependent oxidoreductase [Solirubrobacteraceae bacterium]|nr:NAD(P)/FAD-dependent oxidoreductase [Solirubrobacteraceae bacterium]